MLPSGQRIIKIHIKQRAMNWQRKIHLIRTSVLRAMHRRGFGIQSPWAYEMVRDVLFEPLAYYAYEEQGLRTESQRQMFRIKNHFRGCRVVVIDDVGPKASAVYDDAMAQAAPGMVVVMEHAEDANAALWQRAVMDERAVITFDMGRRGLIVIDPKRIKQNYLL